ncbi:EcoAI/FtnUII family type I restriction enzme subunit R [Mastigocoleus testarum]|uniref:EcoAI/FtnUII family type I restriction enzme subunit R n=1 Tax=Mastigocoleus testarum TaxID=996925 RepID=UPI0003FA5426|nr:DEAD/DEAH box helicase family protein [Mastigocoleus testarum]
MAAIDKKSLSEPDICTKYITPALEEVGWDKMTQLRQEVPLTKGKVLVRGRLTSRGKSKRADYILYYKPNIPIAVIEAKNNKHSVGSGMQQALGYAEMLDVPFAYSSNGDAFLEHDFTGLTGKVEQELRLDSFPSPQELWRRYCVWKGIGEAENRVVTQDYYSDGSGKKPRYYQLVAINRTIEAIAKGENRILLVMATGTGKTFTAFQIIWRLWKSRTKKRILFLADRNILIDQTKTNDFKPFGKKMTKITKRQVDKSYEIYLALYQGVSGNEETKNIYKQFSPEFFDLVIIDECHRGSAAEDSAWREILEYFSKATQIGLTATPKETEEVSNIDYFGEPIYTYSLKEGIEDGFLAPYKVIRIDIDKDLSGWRPTAGQRDKYGKEIEDRVYNQKDIDRTLVLERRTELVAKKVSEFLKTTNDRFAKTIVFCEDIDHAERMRQALVNENSDLVLENRKYVMRITGDDKEGKEELDNFIFPDSTYPVIATTSKLMTTGVDAQTCKLIVLDRRIQSMTEFKQIIGRGTRINEEYGKSYFTIMDFKKATELFADPDFDGEPVQIYEPKTDHDSIVPPDEEEDNISPDDVIIDPPIVPDGKRIKYVVDDVEVSVIAERVQYYGKDGKLITESLKDYTRKTVTKEYRSLDDFLRRWSESEQKQAIINELHEQGVIFEALESEVGKDFDPFDLICHVAFDRPPLSRKERAQNVRKRDYFSKYGDKAKAVLNALLDKYASEGIEQIEGMGVLKVPPFTELATPMEIIKLFGGKQKYLEVLRELKSELYKAS